MGETLGDMVTDGATVVVGLTVGEAVMVVVGFTVALGDGDFVFPVVVHPAKSVQSNMPAASIKAAFFIFSSC